MPIDHGRPNLHFDKTPADPPPITGVATSITAFIGGAQQGPLDKPRVVHSFAEFQRVFGPLAQANPLGYAVQHYFLNGGRQAVVVRVAAPDQVVGPGFDRERRGLYALDEVDLVNLLCLPPFSFERDVDPDTWQKTLMYCKARRAMLLVDPPANWGTPEQALSGMEGLNLRDENAALYFPRLKAADPLQGDALVDFAPSGAVAGVIARMDERHGVWKAPAGEQAVLLGIADLAYHLDDPENSLLNQAGINCLRTFPEAGSVIWGARTLAGGDQQSTEWKYIPVRRFALFLEESLERGAQWAVFEPNGEALWSRVRRQVEAFLYTLFREGAFAGSTTDQAYFVHCDRQTMTEEDIENGILNIPVGFAPLKPAEFVILKIQQKLAG